MRHVFKYKEACVLHKLFEKENILTEEEKSIIQQLKSEIEEYKASVEEHQSKVNTAQADFDLQVETNNFKFICGACRNGLRPRCLELYQGKYCSNVFGASCSVRKANPDYMV